MREDQDITDSELQAIHDQVDAEIAANGLPTEEEIRRRIDALNATHTNGPEQVRQPRA